jgi:hypothetical protein
MTAIEAAQTAGAWIQVGAAVAAMLRQAGQVQAAEEIETITRRADVIAQRILAREQARQAPKE